MPTFIYGFQSGEYIKIGITKSIATRLRQLRLYNPHPITVVLKRQHIEAARIERVIHRVLREEAVGREWFKISPEDAHIAANYAIDKVNADLKAEAQWRRHRKLHSSESGTERGMTIKPENL